MKVLKLVATIAFTALGVSLAMGQAAKSAEVTVNGVAGFQDTPLVPGTMWHVHDPARPQPEVVTPGDSFSLGATPPSDAEVLFEGKGLDKWQKLDGSPANWKTTEDYLESAPRTGTIRTRGVWADFQLHVEWASPSPAKGAGQGRGNSGILINNLYEVQVLDSYHAKTYPDGQAGAVYGQSPPLVNASKPPGQWQSYDIIFESPRWNEQGELTNKAVITVLQNGVVVQSHYELLGATGGINPALPWKSAPRYPAPHAPEVFVALQDHSNPVRYRNIWIRPLHPNPQK